MRKFLAMILCVSMMATALVGCGSSAEPAADDAAAVEGAIGLSVSTQNNPFFVTLVEGDE